MSTRRARIKAVAALPPRRKNLENADAKIKQKEHFEQTVKSPRTPRNVRKKSEDKKSPVGNSILSPPDVQPINEAESPAPNKAPSPVPTVISLDSEKLSNTPSSEVTSALATSPQPVTFTRSAYAALAKIKATADQLALLSPPLASVETNLKSVTPSMATAVVKINDEIVHNDANQNTKEDAIPSGGKKIRTQISTPSQEEENTSEINKKDITPSRKKKTASQDTVKGATSCEKKKNTSPITEKDTTPNRKRKNSSQDTEKDSTPSGGKKIRSQIIEDTTLSREKKNTRQNVEKHAPPSGGKKKMSHITEKDTTPSREKRNTRQNSEKDGTPSGLQMNTILITEKDDTPSGLKINTSQITHKDTTPKKEKRNTGQNSEKIASPSFGQKNIRQITEKDTTPSKEKRNTRQNSEKDASPSFGQKNINQITEKDTTPSREKRNTRQNSEKDASPSVGQKNTTTCQVAEKDTTLNGTKRTRQNSENLATPSGGKEDTSQNTAKDVALREQIKRAIHSSEKDTTPIQEKNYTSQNTEKDVTPSGGQKNDIRDDYSVPSVPESVTDYSVPSVPESVTEEAMDGIVPLQTVCSAPKPIDLLKNDIISDHAEVSFDPIVPLPSPSKVRPKLRPVPRLAPHRRNSVQGSASESEDDSRRTLLSGGASATPAPPRQRHDSHTSASHSAVHHTAPHKELSRVRNDSVSSSVSQAATQPPPATSPVKDKHLSSKARRPEPSRRGWYRHRRDAKREALTMYDLIFYNPTTNPIVPDEDEISAKEANAKAEAEKKKEEVRAKESEEDADDPPTDAAPVPQIKLGPNGEIVLDETSLVIKQSDSRRVSSVVREGPWAGGGGRYTRAARTAEWSAPETVRFYRALAAVGTDFTLMAHLFPARSRRDLYLKFKKEERHNGAQVDKALRSATAWDPEHLQEEFTKEREEAAKQVEDERKRLLQKKEEEKERLKALKDMKLRYSRGSKALESAVARDDSPTELTGDEFLRRALAERRNRRKKKENPEFILPTTTPQKPIPRLDKTQPSQYATLTLLGAPTAAPNTKGQGKPNAEMATISRIENVPTAPSVKSVDVNEVSGVPNNIESGSLVVLRVNDPQDRTKTMLQTYIASGAGKLTPVALPPTFLSSVVGYMKKDGSKGSASSSPQLTSPGSVASDSRSGTPGVIQLNPSPNKRQRHSSYSITSL